MALFQCSGCNSAPYSANNVQRDIVKSHDIACMMYADDTQIYLTLKQDNMSNVLLKLEACVKDINNWSTTNGLKLNEGKTEILHFTSRFRSCIPISQFVFDNHNINPVSSARNLGVIFDKHLTMSNHVNLICKTASFALHKISSIRKYLDQKTTETLVHSLVMSRIDSCNSLLFGLPESQINKLQRLQNSAARLVTRTRPRDPITPILRNLHWLPVHARIKFKILILTFHCLQSTAPVYLQDLVQKYTPNRNLRSKSKSLLVTPTVVTKSYGARSFQVAAPELWNSLPEFVKEAVTPAQFKNRLKTHLFIV